MCPPDDDDEGGGEIIIIIGGGKQQRLQELSNRQLAQVRVALVKESRVRGQAVDDGN